VVLNKRNQAICGTTKKQLNIMEGEKKAISL
jgi:hypothetical protein